MPVQEGVGTILEIRKEFPDLKIIAMSGGTRSGTVDYLEVAEKLGATDTLSKPFHQQRLLSAVRTALGHVETAWLWRLRRLEQNVNTKHRTTKSRR